MVGPPSSWSRDQEESFGRLGQRTIRIAGVCLPRGRSLSSCPPSIPLCQPADRWNISPHDNSQPGGRSATGRLRSLEATCSSRLQSLYWPLLLGRLLGMVGVYRVGDLVHVFLLVGLMLLLLAMLKARDAALRPPNPPTED